MRKIDFWSLLGGFSPGDPENRIRGAILRILVVGELREMTFKQFYPLTLPVDSQERGHPSLTLPVNITR